MNPYTDVTLSEAAGSSESPNPYSLSSSPSIIQTGLSSQNTLLQNQNPPSSQQSVHIWTPGPTLALPGFGPSSENPYAPTMSLQSYQVSINLPSPAVQPSPALSQCSEESGPDLECSVCFSQFNNVFRCPKMLQCKHTFCLECLARINVMSAEPGAIQCPLCRGTTPLPDLGLPRLATDPDVLSYLPAAMQRVYSIRFIRNKGKLQVKRSSEGPSRLGRRSLVNRSLDVGLPSSSSGGGGSLDGGSVGDALFRLTGRPACRAFLLISVVMMMVLLTAIVIFLLTYKNMG